MEKQTIVCTALPNGRAADGALLLSVHIAPRLWSSDTSVGKLALSQFPDLLAWPATLAAASWSVTFDGQPPAAATVVSAAPRADLWAALFRTDTDVVPFRFEDHCDTVIESIDSVAIHDLLSAVYARAATNVAYGAGTNLPPVEILAADPDLSDIARATNPTKLPDAGPPPAPLDLGGKLPEPEREPERPPEHPGPPTDKRWCRCICWLLRWLARPFPPFAAWVDRVCAAKPADDPPPAEETGPTSHAIPTKGIPPGAPLTVTPSPPPEPPLSYTPSGPPSAKKLVFDEVTAFVTPPPPSAKKLPTQAEIEEIYDFHSMVASLGDYPKLMRMLGIVVDLRIEAAAVDAPAAATVKVEPGMAFAMTTTVASPRTHYLLDDTRFLAAARADDPEINNGLLRLNDETKFRVIQVDVVGSALKLQNAATNTMILSDKTKRAPNTPADAGLPALRTGGISVVRRNFRNELSKQFMRSAALQRMLAAKDSSPAPAPVTVTPPDPTDELFAEDLVRGYRVDVFDTKWRSLCQRKGTYDFLDAPGVPGGAISLDVEDEGFVQFSATTQHGSDTSKSLRTTDSLFVWDGWSLCAPRPGKTIMAEDKADGTTNLDEPKNEAKTKFKFEANFKVKAGSLPRLRYGQTYSLRARICDLAGNSVVEPDVPPLFAAAVPEQTPPFTSLRYEPVSPPAMLQRDAPVEGESLERMVVRTPAIGGTDQATERHIIPPKVSQLVAEQHGKFDGMPADPAKMDGTSVGYDRAARESGALTDGATKLATATTGQNAGDLIWVFSGEQYQLTYLPDPASRGALLLGLPGLDPDEIVEPPPASPMPVNKVPFAGTWPALESFRLRLAPIVDGAAPAQPHWDQTKRVLTVELAPAQKQVVRINSYFATDDFAKRGVSDWIKNEAPAAAGQFETDAVAGRSWLHLPWREITLVHAVLRPLQPTTITKLAAEKQLGATTATLDGTLAPHVASTGKVDIVATWEDPVDDPAQPVPGKRESRSHLCEVLVPDDAIAQVAVEAGADKKLPVHQFHDTKFHRVTYKTIATTRFREYFPVTLTKDAANITLDNPAGVSVPILNSARPDAPRVLYIVPTYGWKKDAPGASTSHHRKGNGLRVYLDRPWYSSGDDERLGVVFIPDAKFIALSKVEKALVTQWAADPIWLSDPTTEAARMNNFLDIADKGDGLILAETGQAVSAAGYKVEFDTARRLWFADVTLDIGASYTPFVRLALARFQPNSVGGAHLSRIVRAEFAQLAADRSATYTVNATASGGKVDILVKGPTYTASGVTLATDQSPDLFGKESGRKGLSEIEARLQRRNPAFGTQAELAWDTLTTELLTQKPIDPGVWQGTVTLSGPLTPGEFRILLLEYEWYRSDFGSPEGGDVSVARRIVYADSLSLG